MDRPRIHDFKGPLCTYVEYLEDLVHTLLKTISQQRLECGQSSIKYGPTTASTDFAQTSTGQCLETLSIGLQQQPESTQFSVDEKTALFKIETPQTWATQARPSRKFTAEPKCVKTADFLATIPACESDWFKARANAQLSRPEDAIRALRLLTLRFSSTPPTVVPRIVSTTSSLKTLESYLQLQRSLRGNAIHWTQIRHYSDLLLHCICCVAREAENLPYEQLDNLIKAYFPDRKQQSKYTSRLRHGAAWIARLIETLEATIGRRGSQLFLLRGQPMEKYRTWADCPATADHLITQVTAKLTSTRDNMPASPSDIPVSFSPTFIIASMGPWELDVVNNALGTKLDHEEFNRRMDEVEALGGWQVRQIEESSPLIGDESSPTSGTSDQTPTQQPTPGTPAPTLDGRHHEEPTTTRAAKRRKKAQAKAVEVLEGCSGFPSDRPVVQLVPPLQEGVDSTCVGRPQSSVGRCPTPQHHQSPLTVTSCFTAHETDTPVQPLTNPCFGASGSAYSPGRPTLPIDRMTWQTPGDVSPADLVGAAGQEAGTCLEGGDDSQQPCTGDAPTHLNITQMSDSGWEFMDFFDLNSPQ